MSACTLATWPHHQPQLLLYQRHDGYDAASPKYCETALANTIDSATTRKTDKRIGSTRLSYGPSAFSLQGSTSHRVRQKLCLLAVFQSKIIGITIS